MDRRVLLAHIRRTHFAPGDEGRAHADARRIAAFLKKNCGTRVVGMGSLFSRNKQFMQHSDIDLVVEGLAPEHFYSVSAKAAWMTSFPLDLIPLETATEVLRQRVGQEGVEL